MKKILYISDITSSEPIFHSQVMPHINELKKYFNVTLMVLSRKNKMKLGKNVDLDYYSVNGDYFYYLAKIIFLKQKKRIQFTVKSAKFDLIYSRGIRGGIVGSFIKKFIYNNRILLLNDIRGDALDEHAGNFINKVILDHSNKIIYKNADILFIVSNYLKKKICQDYSFNTDKAYVFPTFVKDYKFDFNNKNRESIRKELYFSNEDIVILYSGNLSKWQNIETILSAFKLSSNPNLKMLILTINKGIVPLIKKYDLPNDKIKIKSAVYEDIEKYYHAADFGILIRDNIDTNKSAAPTKFSEYVNSGLSLIINSIEADYVQIFKNEKLKGFLLDKKESLLNCFNEIGFSHVQRNSKKINILSNLVKNQAEILDNFLDHYKT